MYALRRYVVYVGIAACILLSLSYIRRDLLIDHIPSRPHPKFPASRYGGSARPPALPRPHKAPEDINNHRFHWEDVPIRYPVGTLTPLPTAPPTKLPKVQHGFSPEKEAHAKKRKERQAAVRHTFERCWNAYKKHAWMKDELAPLSGGSKDGFGGWAANLVDNLDNLWIMGLKPEFEDAVKAAMEIDLSGSTIETVNVFETTIRHLGGLLSAYDLSGDKRLLHKAKEFGAMLYKAFDTPNRMPITRWMPQKSLADPQEAPEQILVAEIGSLTMEFTRLSQITGDAKWYDAVDRITRIFAEQQDQTHLPGMWPVVVNAKLQDFKQDTFYTLNAMSDSLYEYFPKMHALLGGVEPVYKKLYEGSMATADKYNLWRPMTPDNADILISGSVRTSLAKPPKLEPQGQHLGCFTGGMYALGGKLFSNPAHVELGKKLTDGCIWSYKALPLGIMPEVFKMVPCDSRDECTWDEKKWRDQISDLNENRDVDGIISSTRLPKGFTEISDRRYILRPEAIESVFVLYRITGEDYLLDAAWDMFSSIVNVTETHLANAAMRDITYTSAQLKSADSEGKMDSMESFWMAETLKYFYLIFSEPSVISLDQWVFNTEAHPFKRRVPE